VLAPRMEGGLSLLPKLRRRFSKRFVPTFGLGKSLVLTTDG
jgi:hypothetical protein